MEISETKSNERVQKTFSLLINHFQFLLDSAFIVGENKSFRLIVHDGGAFKHDQTYSTDKEARERFLELFKFSDEEINDNIKPIWDDYRLFQDLLNRTQSLYIKHLLKELQKCHS
jgi:hypothetical protein